MNILIVNPIIYTSETKNIKRAYSIKDTMIYDLCLAFIEEGHKVTLFAAEPYKPEKKEDYPFEVIWGKCIVKGIFMPHCFPLIPELISYINKNKNKLDLIISSEIFSMHSFISVLCANEKLIIWHELAKHNSLMKKLPSKIWYNFIARFFMRKTNIVCRSEEAYDFINKYCKNASNIIIEHGVNLHKFISSEIKEKYFIVCSQLIKRKRIDGIIINFKEFLKLYDSSYKLYIIGEGEKKAELIKLAKKLKIDKNVIFTGKMRHEELLPYLAHAKALLVNTEKDNSMISIIESIAVGTPILTTDIPLNSRYIKKNKLGISKEWNALDLIEIVENNEIYVRNCLQYRKKLSTVDKVNKFIDEIKKDKWRN